MFENIFGNNSIKNILKQSIDSNKVSHSYLMIGVSGIGKKMIATEFAKGILCLSEDKACNHCKSCIEFSQREIVLKLNKLENYKRRSKKSQLFLKRKCI